jgi:uncharacterized protein
MKIQVAKIPEEGLKLDLLKEGDWCHHAASEGEHGDFTFQPVRCSLTVRRSEKTVIIEGRVETIVDGCCSRCLEEAHVPVETPFRYAFLPAHEVAFQDTELSADDMEYSYFDGEIIDLVPLMYEQIVLQIPIKTLCREDCRGLCPHCGTNLNGSTCDCDRSQGDERFAVLKHYRNSAK